MIALKALLIDKAPNNIVKHFVAFRPLLGNDINMEVNRTKKTKNTVKLFIMLILYYRLQIEKMIF